MANLVGTQTAANLEKAFAGESQARTRYLFYSGVAKDEGYASLEAIFLETADNERGHAEIFFDYLTEGLPKSMPDQLVTVPVFMGSTADNLLFASDGENIEWTQLYPGFAKIARCEGFDEIATSFDKIATIEHRHDLRYKDLYARLMSGMLYKSNEPVQWRCLNCGYTSKGACAPDECPACHHPQQYFHIVCANM